MKTTAANEVVESAPRISATGSGDDSVLLRPTPTKVPQASTEYRIALLTPYDGGNLGDAAIQDAMIENMRRRMPGVRLTGISMSCKNFLERHGEEAFPLCGTDRPFYRLVHEGSEELPRRGQTLLRKIARKILNLEVMKKVLRRVPSLQACLKSARVCLQEAHHWVDGYRFLRTQDLLIVSGGGQLDEEYGGPWGHPYALFKWAMLAQIARVPYAVASVGACKVRSMTSRLLVSSALGLARYRSYRDSNSRDFAASLLRRAATDPVVPDLAFGLSVSEPRPSASIRLLAAERAVIAISPIAFAKPWYWPQSDPDLYGRYREQLARAVSLLLERGYFLVMVFSSRGDDESVIPDILEHLDGDAKKKVEQQVYVPRMETWRDFVNTVREVDLLIASRLHSTILGFIAQRPTIAISFDPKVDWVMKDLDQTEYLLHIGDFVAEDVVKAVGRAQLRRDEVTEKLTAYQSRNMPALARQYDLLAGLAMGGHRSPALRHEL